MERVVLALLALCAVLGAGLVEDAPSVAVSPAPIIVDAPLPNVAAPPPNPDDAIATQILERFAMRHTALSERERIALAYVIIEEARKYNLEPDLVMAVIEVESAGYHLAKSHVGALGLMQLLPSTGKELAGKRGIEWKGPDTLFDPIINVRLGTTYLRELADRYDGNVSIALAAYNWGPGRIDRRLRRGATVPSQYIEKVMRAVDRYTVAAATRS